jgi:hypothetical protein
MKFLLIFITFTAIIYSDPQNNNYMFNEVDGYVRISKETSQYLVEKMNYPCNVLLLEKFDYIFQKYPFDTIMAFPYIRVQINESGRLTNADLLEFAKDRYKYDPVTHYLTQENPSQLNVIIPTQLGTINIFCYSADYKFDSDKKSFVKFVNSIILSSDVKYKPSFIHDNPIINNVIHAGKSILLLLFLAIIVIVRIKNRKNMV